MMAAVKSAELRVRMKVMTWQELTALLPAELQEFLDVKYGIVPPGRAPSAIEGLASVDDEFSTPRIFLLRSVSAPAPAKSSKARSVTRMM